MTRKRFIKLMMGHGVQRNVANEYAGLREKNETYFDLYSEIEWFDDGTARVRESTTPFDLMGDSVYAALQAITELAGALSGAQLSNFYKKRY